MVEDNRDVGTFVTQTAELGYRTWVENAQAALDKLATSPGAHDIVFSDEDAGHEWWSWPATCNGFILICRSC